MQVNLFPGPQHLIVLLKLWEALGFHFKSPVVGCSERLWTRRYQRRKFDIARSDPKATCVFTGTSALHGGGHHDCRDTDFDAWVDGSQKEALCTTTTGAGDRESFGINIGKALQKVDGPKFIIGLLSHHGLQV